MMDFPNGQPEQVDWLGQKSQVSSPTATHMEALRDVGFAKLLKGFSENQRPTV